MVITQDKLIVVLENANVSIVQLHPFSIGHSVAVDERPIHLLGVHRSFDYGHSGWPETVVNRVADDRNQARRFVDAVAREAHQREPNVDHYLNIVVAHFLLHDHLQYTLQSASNDDAITIALGNSGMHLKRNLSITNVVKW